MRYLFQGDSITDAGRGDYENPGDMGCGYPRLLEAELTFEDKSAQVLNCGISGNRVVDLLARWRKDALNLKPDVLTILIGVNDVWHEFGGHNGVREELFEKVYRLLLEETLRALPDVKIILMGAYVIHGPSTDGDWEVFDSEVRARREVTRRLAEEFHLGFVDLQKAFDDACQKALAAHWSGDGVHPTAAGHMLIARTWRETAGKMGLTGLRRPGKKAAGRTELWAWGGRLTVTGQEGK